MDAFAELAQRHHTPALIVARSIVDHATAEDVVADSFERLMGVLARGDGPTHSLRPYFLQMVRHRAIDSHRRHHDVPLTDSAESADVDSEPIADDPIRSAFESLPERWRTALWLSAVDGFSHAEIGRELGLSENAVNQLVHRAKEGLRQAYLTESVSSPPRECRPYSELLGKYVRGRCGTRAQQRVKAHVETCARCQSTVADLRQLNTRIGGALAVGVLGGVGLALVRQPAQAMAAEGLIGIAAGAGRGGLLRAAVGVAAAGSIAVASLALTAVVGSEPESSAALTFERTLADPPISTPLASPTPTPTPTPTPKPTPAKTVATVAPPVRSTQPSASPTPSPANPTPKGVDVVVGAGHAELGASTDWLVEFGAPVTAPSTVSLVATITLDMPISQVSARSGPGYGAWRCSIAAVTEASSTVSCTDSPGEGHDLVIAVDNYSSGGARIEVYPVGVEDVNLANNVTAAVLPSVPQ
ncbi:MAG TPA: hypothetical protein DCM67_07730 [Propionibacteriaceae bacterium]|nr:hypothetical protein [Propionibacteriaceae bacterium]